MNLEYLASSLFQLIWPGLAIATFIVSFGAHRKFPNSGGTLMLVGAGVSVLASFVGFAIMSLANNGNFGVEDFTTYSTINTIVNVVGQVLFLVGLAQLISAVAKKDTRVRL